MARGNQPKVRRKTRWVAQPYRDHANQPAVLMVHKVINAEEIRQAEGDFEANPEFALQVYSTIPLDSDHTTLCEYLYQEINSEPSMSFEIYSPQPNVFACVEHHRREIAHRKTATLGVGFFPGIAKAVPNRSTWLPQGLLLVITSHSYREGVRAPDYDETGPLWVNFNRSFPLKAKVDMRSRLVWVRPTGYNPSEVEDSDISPEGEEIIVRRCRHIYYLLQKLHFVLKQSYNDVGGFDYGLNEDEGDSDSQNQQPALEMIESWQSKTNSYPRDDFSVQLASEEAILIKSKAADVEPDLQYIIYISFTHTSSQLPSIALAFTAAIIENLPRGKTINFEFYSVSSQPLSAILDLH
ncbi:hypothetical protein ZTR_09280 [Talaromyces verruculosus]|nr:hypothetical protein ZTR_09280 [Talaromyces verruculosus]